ncbi:unnamed protein product [Somion occarium]|uniref:Uncharacterized protein n=2 Tax=Somion occarium TaxID=3059160 RepID=A0ABP1CN05_9APHY
MSPCHRIFALAFAFFLGFHYVSATSSPPRPLKRIAHPSTLALEILPRRPSSSGNYGKRSFPIDEPTLQHTDSFRLKLTAFDDTYYLHLRPNEHLIHPAARIKYYKTGPNGDSILSHTEPLLPQSIKAYWGEVIPADVSPDRMREDAAGVWLRPSGKSELGWARITVHHQGDIHRGIAPSFEGAFSVNGVVHHVMTKENYLRNKHHLDPHVISMDEDSSLVIFRDSDIMSPHEYHAVQGLDSQPIPKPPKACGHDRLKYNTDPSQNPALRRPAPPPTSPWYDPFRFLDTRAPNATLVRRDDVAGGGMGINFQDHIGDTVGCPATQKIVFMGVAADCEYVRQYGSQQNASQQIISNFNTASALYKNTFNVSLGIVELQIQDPQCPSTADSANPWNVACSNDITLNSRLSVFSDWRGKKGADGAGLWHLMSGCPTGTEVGIAWLATLCQVTSSGSSPNVVSGAAVSTSGRVEWQVIAHEIGHNFGAIHDCTDGCDGNDGECCPLTKDSCNANSQFIMSPVAEAGETKFSQCSLGNICSLMLGNSGGMTNTSCLADPGSGPQLISLQMCGNGIVEEGEDCDPGTGSTSSCCDVDTCKFRSGAVCDPDSSPCCTGECTFAPTTQVCRPSKDSLCDQPEMCTGNSSSCPSDVFSPNGQSCGDNGLACANGVCTSLDKQCQTVGASMNLSRACNSQNDRSCQVSCQDPRVFNQCVILQSTLIDGSPCGYGGTCVSGNCQSGSFLDTAKSWYTSNLQISIPVTIVAAVVLLLVIWGVIAAIRGCIRGSPSRRRRDMRKLSSWDGPPPVVFNAGGPRMAQMSVPPSIPPYATRPTVPGQGPAPMTPQGHTRYHSSGSWEEHYPLNSPEFRQPIPGGTPPAASPYVPRY